jgi:hypothetical protein
MEHEIPPERITTFHARPLLDAEAGRLKYDFRSYRNHGVSNNAIACVWCGLLADAGDGLVPTELGAEKLAAWKRTRAGRLWLASIAPPEPEQFDLFGEVVA